MWILLIGIVILGILTAAVSYWQHRKMLKKLENGEITQLPEESTAPVQEECCGQHATCEKDSLLAAVSRQVEYYDDEELDLYRHTPSDQYPEEALELFREVFYTLKETDVAGWVRSLQLREIELPDEIKDEVFLIVGERRIH